VARAREIARDAPVGEVGFLSYRVPDAPGGEGSAAAGGAYHSLIVKIDFDD
jgi:hypothetical protein